MNKTIWHQFAILAATIIWGAAFLAQKLGADHFGPFAIVSFRNFLGAGFLALFLLLPMRHKLGKLTKTEFVGGTISGIALSSSMLAQQIGIETTTPGISAFLTANYVVLVPVFVGILGLRRPKPVVWLSVLIAIIGSFLVSVSMEKDSLRLGVGEAWTLACAALFAIQIMIVNHYSSKVNIIRFSALQLLSSAIITLPFIFLPCELRYLNFADFWAGLPALLFIGILSSGIAYTLQNIGQVGTPPTIAAIIMSLESVFGALFGWWMLGDTLTLRQLVGCALVFVAVILPQLRLRRQ